MPVTVNTYNHTTKQFLSGLFVSTNTWRINLYSVFVFDATATTKTAAEVGATQLPTLNGYTQNTATLASVTVSTVDTDDAIFDFANPSWSASGGDLIAAHAMIYNDTLTNDPPAFHIDFGGNVTAVNGGAPLVIVIPANGLVKLAKV